MHDFSRFSAKTNFINRRLGQSQYFTNQNWKKFLFDERFFDSELDNYQENTSVF